jgi:hypothetical protein
MEPLREIVLQSLKCAAFMQQALYGLPGASQSVVCSMLDNTLVKASGCQYGVTCCCITIYNPPTIISDSETMSGGFWDM